MKRSELRKYLQIIIPVNLMQKRNERLVAYVLKIFGRRKENDFENQNYIETKYKAIVENWKKLIRKLKRFRMGGRLPDWKVELTIIRLTPMKSVMMRNTRVTINKAVELAKNLAGMMLAFIRYSG